MVTGFREVRLGISGFLDYWGLGIIWRDLKIWSLGFRRSGGFGGCRAWVPKPHTRYLESTNSKSWRSGVPAAAKKSEPIMPN